MDIDKLPDNEMKALNVDDMLTMQKRKYLLVLAGLMLLDILLFAFVTSTQGDATDNLFIALKTLICSSIVLGFALGLITARIPYKHLNYSEKYSRASLLNIIIIQILLIIGQIFWAVYTSIVK